MGRAFEEVEDYREAESNYSAALSLCQKHRVKYSAYAQASYGMGNSCLLQQKYSEALKYYEQALPLLEKESQPTAVERIGSCREHIHRRMNDNAEQH